MSRGEMAATPTALATAGWTAVAVTSDIPLREGRLVAVRGTSLAVFNLGDRFLTVDNRCPHKGGPLSDGIVTGGSVVCPLHGWRICLATGEVQRPCAAAPAVGAYDTTVADGIVFVALPAAPRPQADDGAPAAR